MLDPPAYSASASSRILQNAYIVGKANHLLSTQLVDEVLNAVLSAYRPLCPE